MAAFRSRSGSFIEERVPTPPTSVEDEGLNDRVQQRSTTKRPIRPSQWVERFIKIKNADKGVVENMDFSRRRYLLRIYDTSFRKKILVTSRQTEKSTSLGNILLSKTGLRSIYTSLFVSPSAMQTKVFSTTRLDDIVEVSPLMQALTGRNLVYNLLEKEFLNKSKIYLRYAFLSADRIRGLSVNALFIDEIQDFMQDLLPVIEETTSHHKNPEFCYSGTPKTQDNTIETYWSKHSTQSEWVIPCERHGTPKDPKSWHWVVLGPENLGLHGPICEKCGGGIDPEHPMAQWVEMNPGAQFEGYRICRLMVPWFKDDPEKWSEILQARERFPTAQFMNEVMALSYDSGQRPLTKTEVRRVCDDRFKNDEEAVIELGKLNQLYMGIDWGTGEEGAAYTVVTVGGYVRGDNKFQIVFAKRFTGQLAEPKPQIEEIKRLIRVFRIHKVGVDYGFGWFQNKELISTFGPTRVYPYAYIGRSNIKVRYDAKQHRTMLFRTPIMTDIFQAIKKAKIMFFNWEEFEAPFANDMLSIRSEYNETLRIIQYIKTRGKADDTFHSVTYCVMASMLDHRRPDILASTMDMSEEEAREAAAEMEYNQSLAELAAQTADDPWGDNY